ncbi:hypothetical protein FM107_15660 [Sphingobacterium sp. JB170]|nr:hypothetical protein FM107_15660 [Sphingobacterium sp. JB170]
MLGYLDKDIKNPKLVAWLYVIMENVYKNKYRKMQKRTPYESFQVFLLKMAIAKSRSPQIP